MAVMSHSASGYMLENPSICPVLVVACSGMGSKKPDCAENQQERLIRTGWVVGFVDGEGCFSIGFTRQPNRVNRKGYKTGYQVSHRFVVTQGSKSLPALKSYGASLGRVGST